MVIDDEDREEETIRKSLQKGEDRAIYGTRPDWLTGPRWEGATILHRVPRSFATTTHVTP
jgi:hypothetical protein